MPIDPRIYVDGVGDSNVHDALYRALGAVHDRLTQLEANLGGNPQTMVDSINNPPNSQNPPPQNPAGLTVAFASGIYTVKVTAPWNVAPQSGNQLGRIASLGGPQTSVSATYFLEQATDINFTQNVTDFGVGSQHVFTIPGPPGLFFRVSTSIDGGNTFGAPSPARSLLIE